MALFGKKNGRKGYDRLSPVKRAITFYAEDDGSWPHLGPIVEELLGRHGRDVAYLTSSDVDPVLQRRDERLHAFLIDESYHRTGLFTTMEAGVVVMTVPELGDAMLPRSKAASRLGTDYMYVFHSMVSTHMVYKPHAFDGYDTIFTVGPYMEAEVRAREAQESLSQKRLVAHGYGRLDTLIESAAEAGPPASSGAPVVLVAPSWGPDGLFERCGAGVVEPLLEAGMEVIARPHPVTASATPAAIEALEGLVGRPGYTLDTSMASWESLLRSHVMISDWSGAAFEFAFGLERPVVFVDVPRKVNNEEYASLGIDPVEVTIRDQVGRVVAEGDIGTIPSVVRELLAPASAFRERVLESRAEHVYNVGSSAAVAADHIVRSADEYFVRRAR